MVKTYNKLVRDRIPEIIECQGKKARVKVLDEEKYIEELNKKLQEEVDEYFADGNPEELADISEVIIALAEVKNADLEKIRLQKRSERGGFEDRIFLESVEE